MVRSSFPVPTQALAILHIVKPFQGFFRKLTTSGFLLLFTTTIAIYWANTDIHSYEKVWHTSLSLTLADLTIEKSLVHWIDEALMTMFFFVVGLEIKREILVGELSSARKAILPVAGAVGGMLVPALIYMFLTYGTEGASGWGIPMATDIAFAIAVLSIVRKRLPFGITIFLSALAIADDIGAVLVIAVFYSGAINWFYLGLAILLLVALALANLLWIRYTLVYALLGIGIWVCFLGAGLHATVAGVVVAFFIPARGKYDTAKFFREVHNFLDKVDCRNGDCGHTMLTNQDHANAVQSIEFACHNTETPLQRLEHGLNGYVSYIVVPLFALANAGVVIEWQQLSTVFQQSVTLGVVFGLVLGKPLGIMIFTFLASVLFKSPLSVGVTWLHIAGVSMLAGIGFTMSIFITGLSLSSYQLVEMAKVGIIFGSLFSALSGLTLLYLVSTAPSEDRS